ncbi:Ionotropic receptor 122, partial [Hyalella azteca]
AEQPTKKKQTLQQTLGRVFRDPVNWRPERHSSRLLLSVVWLYVIVITVAYCSNLTALLTVTKIPPAFETIKGLYDTGLEVTSLGDFFRGALASAIDPYLKGLADRFMGYDDLGSAWSRVQKGDAVYLHNRQFLEYTIATYPCARPCLRIMKECFAPYSIALALQQHSPLKAAVDASLLRLIESGLVRHWFLESLALSRQ